MKNTFHRPKLLKEWILDIPDGELFILAAYDNQTIVSSSGRFSHSSGATNFTWQQLLDSEFDSHILKIFGNNILQEVKTFIYVASKFNLNNFLTF